MNSCGPQGATCSKHTGTNLNEAFSPFTAPAARLNETNVAYSSVVAIFSEA